MTGTPDFIQLNYNTSLNFFHSFDQSLTTIQHVYNDYNLFIVWYGVLFILGTLFAIKLVTLLIHCIQGWPKATGFQHDFNEFRRNKDTGPNRNDNNRGDEQVEMPLIHRVQCTKLATPDVCIEPVRLKHLTQEIVFRRGTYICSVQTLVNRQGCSQIVHLRFLNSLGDFFG